MLGALQGPCGVGFSRALANWQVSPRSQLLSVPPASFAISPRLPLRADLGERGEDFALDTMGRSVGPVDVLFFFFNVSPKAEITLLRCFTNGFGEFGYDFSWKATRQMAS